MQRTRKAPTRGPFSLFRFFKDPPAFALAAAREVGDVVRVPLGPSSLFLVSHPELADRILRENNEDFSRGRLWEAGAKVHGESILTDEGQAWRKKRSTLQPAFRRERIAGLFDTMADVTRAQIDGWSGAATAGTPVNMTRELTRATGDSFARVLFGSGLSDDELEGALANLRVLQHSTHVVFMSAFLPSFFPMPGRRRTLRAREANDRILRRLIEERRASGEEGSDLLGILAFARDEESGEQLGIDQLCRELRAFFFAGYETTSNALTWAVAALNEHPEAAAGVVDEIQRVLNGRPPSAQDLPQLALTRCFVDEVLRFYPVAWGLPRQAARDTEVGGYAVPKGAMVMMCLHAIHQRADVWERPEEFNPARFSDEAKRARPKLSFLTFGGGMRKCIGEHLARTQILLTLTQLLQRFEVTARSPVGQKATHAIVKVDPDLIVQLSPREGALHPRVAA